jgi:hypothetical protein
VRLLCSFVNCLWLTSLPVQPTAALAQVVMLLRKRDELINLAGTPGSELVSAVSAFCEAKLIAAVRGVQEEGTQPDLTAVQRTDLLLALQCLHTASVAAHMAPKAGHAAGTALASGGDVDVVMEHASLLHRVILQPLSVLHTGNVVDELAADVRLACQGVVLADVPAIDDEDDHASDRNADADAPQEKRVKCRHASSGKGWQTVSTSAAALRVLMDAVHDIAAAGQVQLDELEDVAFAVEQGQQLSKREIKALESHAKGVRAAATATSRSTAIALQELLQHQVIVTAQLASSGQATAAARACVQAAAPRIAFSLQAVSRGEIFQLLLWCSSCSSKLAYCAPHL